MLLDLFEQKVRDNSIESGDLLVVQGRKDVLSKSIKLLSGANIVHTAMLLKFKTKWFVLEAKMTNIFDYPLKIIPISCWLEENKNEVMYIAKKPNSANHNFKEQDLKNFVLNSINSTRPYGFIWLLIVYFIQDWLGKPRPSVMTKSKPYICSTLIQEIWEELGIIKEKYYRSPADIVYLTGGIKSLIPFNSKRHLHIKESKRIKIRHYHLNSNGNKQSPMKILFTEKLKPNKSLHTYKLT